MIKRNIGIIHFIVGRTDGVSLEIDKWKRVLEEMGHAVHLCGGDLGHAEGTLIEEIYHRRPDARRLNHSTFHEFTDYPDEAAYREELYGLAEKIELKLKDWITEKKIDFLIPQNVWCVGANPAVAIAVTRVMREFNIPALAHNHDFFWERIDGVALTSATAIELAQKYLPPRDPLAKHAVINSLARDQLLARKGIDSTVVPNVFDFVGDPWIEDDYNSDFRKSIGLNEDDILILQATRIVRRKGIELAIDFVAALDTPDRREILAKKGLYDGRQFNEDSRIVFVMAGYSHDDQLGSYFENLMTYAQEKGVDILHIDSQVAHSRATENGKKIYSLWDTYVQADFVTYPSLWEGWGNQFLEALKARLPILLFEYPVYLKDIKDKGFKTISLGSEIEPIEYRSLAHLPQALIDKAADEAVEILTDGNLYEKTVNENFEIGEKYYSIDALRGYLSDLLRKFD